MKLLALLLTLLSLGCSQQSSIESTLTVLVMGDSISAGYMPLLSVPATHTPGNARTAEYTAENVQSWLNGSYYSVIVFNNGLHNAFGGPMTPERALSYRQSLEYTANVVSLHADRPIFVLTTAALIMADNASIDILNTIATEVMQAKGIEIVDLHAVSLTLTNEYSDGLHFTQTGYSVLATAINLEVLK